MTAARRRDIPRPPTRLILTTPEHLVAFGFGAGLAPFAPGTFGTLVGVPFFLALSPLPVVGYVAAVAALFAFGCWICGVSSRLLQVHDYPGFVFDEIVGYLVACAPILPALGPSPLPTVLGLVAAFALFRLFDIWKPWPIRAFDRNVGGGTGIMLDDLLAGAAAGGVLYALQRMLTAHG